jgi:threonine/homoserine/homoserine lactone efflux protein
MIAPLLKGLLLGFILSISIGPVVFAILKQSLTNGRKAGYIFVAGVSASDITLLTICNIFTTLFAILLTHKAIIALAGAGFLLLMGLYTLLFKKIKFEPGEENKDKVMRKRDLIGIFAAGFFMNTLNPSVFLFWFAWTAAIGVSAGETSSPLNYKLIVFGTCLLFVLLSDLVKVALAGMLRPRLTEKTMIYINRVSGLIILIFSALLFYGALNYK